MDTLLTEEQILLRKEIGSFLETADREEASEVRTNELRRAFWGPERTLLDRALALEELSRLDPGLARDLAGEDFDRLDLGPVYRSAVLLGKTAGLLDGRRGDLEPAGKSAQRTVDLITALETARFLTFRAACLAGTAAEGAGAEAAKCERLAVDIARRAAGAGRAGRLGEGERP